MPRQPKYPLLQEKFNKYVVDILREKERSTKTEIISKIDDYRRTEKDSDYIIGDDEFSYIGSNFQNFIKKAIDYKIVVGSSVRGRGSPGYALFTPSPAKEAENPPQNIQNQNPESASHFIATCCLSVHYKARLVSLGATTDGKILWGNPDILMLRENTSRQRFRDANLDPHLLALVDHSPECILTSIELKYNLTTRKDWFQAIAEVTANSCWANEALLVNVSPYNSRFREIDSEVIALARAAEVGVFNICFSQEDNYVNGKKMVFCHETVTPKLRSALRLDNMGSMRINMLSSIQAILRDWNDDVFIYLDVPGNENKTISLLNQALQNTLKQNGFKSDPILLNIKRQSQEIRDAIHSSIIHALFETADTDTSSNIENIKSWLNGDDASDTISLALCDCLKLKDLLEAIDGQ